MKKSYSELLKDPRWQKKRLEVLDRDNFTCQICGDNKTTLHVHHKKYDKGKLPWEYSLDDLSTLCSLCHKREHKYGETVLPWIEKKLEDGVIMPGVLCAMVYGYMVDDSVRIVVDAFIAQTLTDLNNSENLRGEV